MEDVQRGSRGLAQSNGAWKGESAGYAAKHKWLDRNFGRPRKCENCGTEKAKKFEWANISGKYHREREDYKCLCTSCHRKMDRRKSHCKNGHLATIKTTYIDKDGHRICRPCAREFAYRRYHATNSSVRTKTNNQ